MLSGKLKQSGITNEDVLGIAMGNQIEYLVSIFAIDKIGAKIVPIYLLTGCSRIELIINSYNVRGMEDMKNFFKIMVNGWKDV